MERGYEVSSPPCFVESIPNFDFVILSEAKDLLFWWCAKQQALRFAQDDKWFQGHNCATEHTPRSSAPELFTTPPRNIR
jgi:hypothetical protein